VRLGELLAVAVVAELLAVAWQWSRILWSPSSRWSSIASAAVGPDLEVVARGAASNAWRPSVALITRGHEMHGACYQCNLL